MKSFLAAVMMLTRLPLWRIITVEQKYYSDTLRYWPLIGFITGFTTLGTYWLAAQFIPALPACILAIIARIFLTGAMHEDGLADFLDGFGGGSNQERILAIMKDSHIGSYGTIGLILYFALYASLLCSFDVQTVLPLILAADVFSKLCASILISSLPYVRKAEESKTKLIYHKINVVSFILIAILSSIPFFLINDFFYLWAILPALVVSLLIRIFLRKKIGGYTGDCCGASVLIIEQVFYLGCVVLYYW